MCIKEANFIFYIAISNHNKWRVILLNFLYSYFHNFFFFLCVFVITSEKICFQASQMPFLNEVQGVSLCSPLHAKMNFKFGAGSM